jgi:hypothetical protein
VQLGYWECFSLMTAYTFQRLSALRRLIDGGVSSMEGKKKNQAPLIFQPSDGDSRVGRRVAPKSTTEYSDLQMIDRRKTLFCLRNSIL